MSLRQLWGIPISLCAVVLVVVLFIINFILSIPATLLGWLTLHLLQSSLSWIVEFLYMIPCIGRRHIGIARWSQKFTSGKISHSRWRDLRVAAENGAYVHLIPNLTDNYCYLVVGSDDIACLIDPGDPIKVLQAIGKIEKAFYPRGFTVKAILNTHKHWDHQGGNSKICKMLPSCTTVYCGEKATPLSKLRKVINEERITVGSLTFTGLAAAGHTRGGMMYLYGEEKQCLFTGDTLFCGGCGNNFEGSKLDMLRNFVTIEYKCNSDALLFPGHEYTEMLLKRAVWDGRWGNSSPGEFFSLTNALYRTFHRRALNENLPTVPVTLAEEKNINPSFLQVSLAMRALRSKFEEKSELEPSLPSEQPGRTFTTSYKNYEPSHMILSKQDWVAIKERYPADQMLLEAEKRPFQRVEEHCSPFGSGPISSLVDILSVCGMDSGSTVLSRERLLWCVREDEDAVCKLAQLFDENRTLTPKECAILLGYDPPPTSCLARLAARCRTAHTEETDDGEELADDVELGDEQPMLQSKHAHAIENCSYCRLQLESNEPTDLNQTASSSQIQNGTHSPPNPSRTASTRSDTLASNQIEIEPANPDCGRNRV